MFCKNCGTKLTDEAGFCTGCGAKIERTPNAPSQSEPKPAPLPRAAVQKPLKDRIFNWLMIPVGILLLIMGLGHLSLAVAGNPATAQVTDCEQVLFLNNDDSTRNPSRYKLEYQFSVNGERYTGSVTRVFPGGSQTRQTIPVRYLPFWPPVNAEDSDVNPAGPVMLGAGILLLLLGVRRKIKNGRKLHV
jgi:hypothetical protein